MAERHNLVMQARDLIRCYEQVTPLDGADFELRAGEILAVIGSAARDQAPLGRHQG